MARVIFMMKTIRNILIIMSNKKTDSDYKSNLWSLDEPSGYLGQAVCSELRFGDKYGTFGVCGLNTCKIARKILMMDGLDLCYKRVRIYYCWHSAN
jgi:hypothetical protein